MLKFLYCCAFLLIYQAIYAQDEPDFSVQAEFGVMIGHSSIAKQVFTQLPAELFWPRNPLSTLKDATELHLRPATSHMYKLSLKYNLYKNRGLEAGIRQMTFPFSNYKLQYGIRDYLFIFEYSKPLRSDLKGALGIGYSIGKMFTHSGQQFSHYSENYESVNLHRNQIISSPDSLILDHYYMEINMGIWSQVLSALNLTASLKQNLGKFGEISYKFTYYLPFVKNIQYQYTIYYERYDLQNNTVQRWTTLQGVSPAFRMQYLFMNIAYAFPGRKRNPSEMEKWPIN